MIEHANAHYLAISNQQLGRELEFAKGNGLDCAGLQVQRAANLSARRVAMSVQDTAPAVRALACKRDLRSRTIEFRTPLDELFNPWRAFFDQDARCFLVAQTIASL